MADDAADPPVDDNADPPADDPPADPPVDDNADPPADDPPADDPPDDPPADPPADPPVDPPADPPANDKPADQPPADDAKATDPPTPKKKKKGKKSKKSKKKKKKSNDNDDGGDANEYWNKISKKNASINWFILKLKGKPGKSTKLEFVAEGTGGAAELQGALEAKNKSILFALLRAKTTDDAQSVRAKFIYVRFIGSGVGVMSKAKLTPALGKIDGHFPVKHLTLNLNENCSDELQPKKLATELLRIGGAHKPDFISFGPDQQVTVKDL